VCEVQQQYINGNTSIHCSYQPHKRTTNFYFVSLNKTELQVSDNGQHRQFFFTIKTKIQLTH